MHRHWLLHDVTYVCHSTRCLRGRESLLLTRRCLTGPLASPLAHRRSLRKLSDKSFTIVWPSVGVVNFHVVT